MRIRALRDLLTTPLRCCCHCGAKAAPAAILCSRCVVQLNFKKLPATRVFERRGDLRCYSLLEWDKESLLQSLVLALKIPTDPLGLWRTFAEELLVRLGEGATKPRSILVPPPRRGWQRDHAGHFGHALAELLKVPCLELLRAPKSARGQKFLSKKDRQSKVYYAKGPVPENLKPAAWADDVVTTGSTARAGLAALDLHTSEVEIWCLVRRRTLAY